MQPIELGIVGKENLCRCVGKHVPLPTVLHNHHIVPKYLGGTNTPDNLIYLCPTTHDNVHSLLRAYAKHGGRPPGSVRKHYSEFVEDLAARAWEGALQGSTPRELSERVLDTPHDS